MGKVLQLAAAFVPRWIDAPSAKPGPPSVRRILPLLILGLGLAGPQLTAQPRPANDNVADASPITTVSNHVSDAAGSIIFQRPAHQASFIAPVAGSTLEPGEANHAGANAVGSVWYTWTAPQRGTLRVVANSNIPSVLGLYTPGLSPVAATTNGTLSATVSSNTAFLLAVANPAGTWADVPVELNFFPPPPNDLAANATVLPDSITVTNVSVGAGVEQVEQILHEFTGFNYDATQDEGDASVRSIWYKWTAPKKGFFHVWFNSSTSMRLDIGTNAPPGFTAIVSSGYVSGSSSVSIRCAAGQTYYLRTYVDSASYVGGYNFRMTYYPEPSNNNFALARLIPITQTTLSADLGDGIGVSQPVHSGTWTEHTQGADTEPGEVDSYWSVWNRVPDIGGNLTIALNSTASPFFRLYSGSALSALSQVWWMNGINSYTQTWSLASGTPYHIRLAPNGTFWECAFEVDATIYPTPANDNFANRQPLTATNVRTNYLNWDGQTIVHYVEDYALVGGSQLGASVDAGEGSYPWTPWRSIWYSWMADRADPVVVSTHGSVLPGGTNVLNTWLSVCTGDAVNALTAVVYNDNADGLPTSRINFTPVPGTEYKIKIDAFTAPGFTKLLVAQPRRHSNDHFTNAIVLSSTILPAPVGTNSQFTLYGAHYNATAETGEPNGTATLWYRWTAPASGPVMLKLMTPGIGTHAVSIYTGDAVNALVNRANSSVHADGNSYASFTADAGVTYHLQVRSPGNSGAFRLNLNQKDTSVPAAFGNDDRADAFAMFPESANTAVRSSASGNARDATLEAGEPDAVTALQNAGSQLNDNYPVLGTNSLWWSYTTTDNSNLSLVIHNSQLTAWYPLHTKWGNPLQELLSAGNVTINGSATSSGISYGADGVYIAPDASQWFTIPKQHGPKFRMEFYYTYGVSSGTTYNTVIGSSSSSYRFVEVRNGDRMLGYYSGGFYSAGISLTPGREYYIALECDVNKLSMWVDGGKVIDQATIWSVDSYYLNYVGTGSGQSKCGGTLRDLRIYDGLPVAHTAFSAWQEATFKGADDDGLVLFSNPATTYHISAIPLTTNSLFNFSVYERVLRASNDDPWAAQEILLGTNVTSYALPNGTVRVTNVVGNAAGNSWGASRYTGERDRIGTGWGTLWYKFTAPRSGSTLITLSSTNRNALALYSATDHFNTITYTSASTSNSMQFTAVAGATYYVQASFEYRQAFQMTVTQPDIPLNDDYANWQPIDFSQVVLTANVPNGTVTATNLSARIAAWNDNATLQSSERNIGYDNGNSWSSGRTVWWRFTAPVNGWYTFDASRSSFKAQVGLHSSSDGVTSSWDYANGTGKLTVFLTAGSVWQLGVDGISGADAGYGGINLDVDCGASPPNDDYANWFPIDFTPVPVSVSVPNGAVSHTNYSARIAAWNDNATLQSSERNIGYDNGNSWSSGRTVWWRFTAPVNGWYTFDASRSSFKAQVGLHSSSDGVTSSWDYANGTGKLTVFLTAGSVWQLGVDGISGAEVGYGAINLDVDCVTAPGNDSFYSPTTVPWATNVSYIELPNGNAMVRNYTAAGAGQSVGATFESGEYNLANVTGVSISGRSVWWSFTAPATGRLTVDTTKSAYKTQVGIKAWSTAIGSGTWLGYSSNGKAAIWVTEGSQYRIVVDGTTTDTGCGGVNLDLLLQEPDSRNNYPGPFVTFTTNVVTETVAEFTLTNYFYTFREAAHNIAANMEAESNPANWLGGSHTGGTLWWNFLPPAYGGWTEVSLAGSPLNTILRVGNLSSVGSSAVVAVNDDYYDQNAAVSFYSTPNQTYTYKAQVDTRAVPGQDLGGINFNIDIQGAPANDLYANRAGITLTGTNQLGNKSYGFTRLAGSTTMAWKEGENFGNWLPGAAANRNLWYKFSQPQDGVMEVTVESPTTHAVALYTTFNSTPSAYAAGTNVTVARWITANTEYTICVDGQQPGPFVMTVRFFPGYPANDAFANRIALTNELSSTGTLEAATRESNEPGFHGNSVWYTFTPECTGVLTIDTEGSPADTLLAVYTGSAINGLSLVALNDNTDGQPHSRVQFAATAGTSYQIAVSAASGYASLFNLTARMSCADAVAARPSSGTYSEPFGVRLSNPAGLPIYYSLNGGPFENFSDRQITYTNLINVTFDTDGLPKKTSGNNWDGGFISAEAIAQDGYAEAVIADATTHKMLGLDAVDSSSSYTDIQYALYFRADGLVDIYENGAAIRSSVSRYTPGDVGRVERRGDVIYYKLNGTIVGTSSSRDSGPLHLDVALWNAGGKMGPCYLVGRTLDGLNLPHPGVEIAQGDADGNVALAAFVSGGPTNTWTYKLRSPNPVVLRGKPITWTSVYGLTNKGIGIQKSISTSAWDSGAISAESSSGDCAVECVINRSPYVNAGGAYMGAHFMIGLDEVDSGYGYGDIQYAIHASSPGYGTTYAYVYQNGSQRANLGPVVEGDRLRVERRNGTIYYYVNDQQKYSTTGAGSSPLHVDVGIYFPGFSLENVTFYREEDPALYVVAQSGHDTRYTRAQWPGSPASVTAASPLAINPVVLGGPSGEDPETSNYRFKNFRTGFAPSHDLEIDYVSLGTKVQAPEFIVPGPVITTPIDIGLRSPSGVGGIYKITFPDGSLTNILSTATHVSFAAKGSGTYKAQLALLSGVTSATTSTNLLFTVSDLAISPDSSSFATAPLTVTAGYTYPMNVFYTFASNGAPNIPYTMPLQIGASNATIRFMGTRSGFSPQFLSRTYTYAPDIVVTPSGQFANATTFTINGEGDLQYSVAGGPWQPYEGPFTLDGLPEGSGTIRAFSTGATNITAISFKAAVPIVTPAGGQVSGPYTVSATSATTNANLYYAIGDELGSVPAATDATNLLTADLNLEGSRTLIFVARKAGYLESQPVTNSYAAKIPTPRFVTGPDTFQGPATITVESGDDYGGQFVLSAPGGSTLISSTTVTNKTATFTINETGEYVLIMRRTGSIDSDAVTNTYRFKVADVVLNPPAGPFYSPLTLYYTWDASNPKPVTIYYTLDESVPSPEQAGDPPNLLSNPGNDLALVGGNIPGWTEVVGANWTQRSGAPLPHSGNYYFFAGVASSAELSQDVDVSSYAADIDAGLAIFDFSGHVRSYGDGDRSRIVVEYRDAANATVLGQYDSGDYSQSATWLLLTDSRTAPAGTRYARVRLIATRVAGSNCDGYFDTLSLTARRMQPVSTFRYTGPFALTNTATVTTLAVRDGYQSEAFTNRYTFMPAIAVSPAPGVYHNPITVTLSGPQGSEYRINNDDWQSYTGPFPLTGIGSGIVNVWTRYPAGPTNQAVYVFRVADPDVQPPDTNIEGSLTVSASDLTEGAVIYYATGNAAGENASASAITNLYAAPITVSSTRQFIFEARKNGFQTSRQIVRTYASRLPAPYFITAEDTYYGPLNVSVGSALSNTPQAFVLTLPGGTAVTNSANSHTTSFTINESGTYQLQVFKSNWLPSPVANATFTFQCADLSVTPPSQTFSDPLQVVASRGSNPKPMTVYYTVDGTVPDPAGQIINPGCEEPSTGGAIPGWVKASGNWTRTSGSAYEGNYYFNPNTSGGSAELHQDVDVSGASDAIDAGNAVFIFSAHVKSGGDQARTIVEYRDAAGVVLSQYDSGHYSGTTWQRNTDTRAAPPGTRTVRVRLIGTLTTGSWIDAWFDAISLTAQLPGMGSTFLYTGPLPVTNTTHFRFLGTRQGYLPQYLDRQYTYAPGLVIAPLSGTNHQPVTVTMTPYNTNSAVYYRINEGEWTPYNGPFGLDGASNGVAVVRAYAITGPMISPTNSVTYTFKVAELTVEPGSQSLPVSVSAATMTPGADIFFARGNDGGETPAISEMTNRYSGPIAVSSTKAFIFEGRKEGYLSSDRATRVFSGVLPPPQFVTPSGTFTNQKAITVKSGLEGYGATFQLLTPGGALVTYASGSDTALININESGEYQLSATKANWLPSGSTNRSYSFAVGDLRVTPASGTFSSSNLIITAQSSISNPKPLRIYYSTDGSLPTTNSTPYTGSLTITNDTMFRWLATRDYYAPQYATNSYSWVPGITLDPPQGTYSNATTFALSTLAPGARLFFSTNTTDWHEYSGPIAMDGFNAGTGTLRATYTNASGFGPTNSFTISFVAATPDVSPTNQTVYSNLTVTASTATSGAGVYYSISSLNFDTVNLTNLYTGPVTVTNRSFMTFQARKSGYQDSANAQRKYIQKLPTPAQLTIGDFTNWVTAFVELPQPISGVSIVVTHPAGTNETRGAPLSGSTGKPLANYTANATGDYIIRATAADWEPSESTTNTLGFFVRDLGTPADQLFNTPVFQVTANSSLFPINPKPLTVYYTTDGSTPDTNSTLHTGPVPINATTTFKWLAMREGYHPQTRTNTYTYVAPLAVTPQPGTYSNAITVTLTSPNGEPIFFSVGGGPWQAYTDPITFDGSVPDGPPGTLSLQAIYTGGTTNFFNYVFQADPPVVTPHDQVVGGPSGENPVTLTAINGDTVGATVVYFEGDTGGGVATTNRPMIAYSEPITVSASRSFLFQARKDNYLPSVLIPRTFTSRLPAPTVLTQPGSFTGPVQVQVQSGLPGYGGAYLMIGPEGTNRITTEAPLATFQANASGQYQFQMQRAGWLDSDPVTWDATFNVADLAVTPAAGLISIPNTPVTARGGSNPKPLKIFYTLDGTVPTTNSTIYAQPILLNEDATITWLATREGYNPLLQTNSYVFVAGVAISPVANSFSNATAFTLTPLGPSDRIYYRTNLSDWLQYTGPFTLDGTANLHFYSQLGLRNSITNQYTATFKVAPVTVSPGSRVFTNSFDIVASSGTTNANIVYARGNEDAGPPPRSLAWITNIYTGPIPQTADNSSYYIFSATKPGYASADWADRIYNAKLPLPDSALGTNLQISAPTLNTLTLFRPGYVWNWTTNYGTRQRINSSAQPFVNITYIHPGTYWYFAQRNGWADSDHLLVTVALKHPDDFAERIDLTLLSPGLRYNNGQAPQIYGALGDITGATREDNEWDGTFDDEGIITTDSARVTSLWYRWVAPTNGLAQIKVFNNYSAATNYFIYGVYTGGNLAALHPVLLARRPAEFMAVAGTEYSISVNNGLESLPDGPGEFQVQLEFYPTPLNDLLTDAIPIVAGQVYSAYTHAATNEPGEPTGNSTWWQFSTLQGGTLEVPLTAGVEASLWQGDSATSLTEIPLQYHTATDYHVPEITTNNYFFALPASGSYKLRVAGLKTTCSFAPKFHLAPSHDNFPNTIRLPAGVQEQQDNYLQSAVSYDSTTLGATLQTSEPATGRPTTVWYQWTAPESGDLDISVGQLFLFSTPGFGTTLTSWQSQPVDFLTIQAFTGNNFSDLVELPHVDNKDSFSSFTLMPNFESEDPAANATVAGAPIAETYAALFTGNVAYTTYREGWWRWRAQFNGDAYLTKLLYPRGTSFSIDVFTGDRYEDLLPQYLYSRYAGDSSIAPQSYFRATMDQVYTFHVRFGNRPATNDNYSFQVEPEAMSRAHVFKGQLVYFRVAGLGSPHRVKLNLTSRASNDDFKDATQIPLQTATYENGRKAFGKTKGRLVGATAESFEPDGAHSVWYKITSPISGHGRARLTGNYSTFVSVYTASSPDGPPDPNDLVSLNPEDFPLAPDTHYFIRVHDLSIQSYTLDVTLSEQPANDLLANALPLQRSSFKAYTDHATVESGEPIKQQSIGESVWWRYAPGLDGTIVVSSPEKAAYLWRGSNLLQLVELANNLAGDIVKPLAKNEEHRISFDTRPGKLEGDFNAVAAYYVLPANDDFINATEITSRQNTVFTNGVLYTYSQRGYTYGAGVQLNEPPVHQKSVWYNWTAPTNLIVYAACELPVYVYTGDNVSALNPIGEKVFSAVGGQTYRIAVSGGPSEFTLTLNGALPAYNDNRNSAIALSGSSPGPVSFYTYASSVESHDQPTTNSYSVWWTWTSGNSTNLFVYPDSKRGPDDPVQGQYPRNFISEIRVLDMAGQIVGQGYVSFDDPYMGGSRKFVLSVPIQPATPYRIAILSPYPTRGWLRLSEKPLPEGCPLGSECNPATPHWSREDSYVNGTIYRSYLLAEGGTAPDPYWFFTKFPWFYLGVDSFGNAIADPQGWLTSSHTNLIFRLNGVDTPYTAYMPVLAGNDADTVRIVTGGDNRGVTLRDVHVPLNDIRPRAIVPPLNVETAPSYSFSTYDNASRRTMWRTYNEMAGTEEDGYGGSVWYVLKIPTSGRLLIGNQTASMLQLIPVDASLDEMIDTNIGVYDYHAELLPNGTVSYPTMTEPVIHFRGKTPVNGSNFPYTEELSWVSPFTGKAVVTVNQSNLTVSTSYTVTESSPTSRTIEFQAERGKQYRLAIGANYKAGGSSLQLKPEIPTVVPTAPLGQPITFGPYGSSTSSREVAVNPGYFYVVQFGDWSAGGINADFYANVSNDSFANATPLTEWQLTRYGNGRIYNLSYRYKIGSATLEPGEPPPAVGDRTLWYSFVAPISGQLQFQGWANIYSGTSLSNLTLLARNDQYNRQRFFVTAGNLYYIQNSGSFGGNNADTGNAITIIEPPLNDYLNTAVPIVTNYNTITNIGGTNYYLYEFTAPAGFWPAVQDNQGRTFYLRNWYRIESEDLADIWVYGWNSTLDGAVVTPGNHAYADINMDTPVTLPNNDPYASRVVVTPEARSELFPTVWGKNAHDINVPWTWNYAGHQQLATVTTNGSSIYDITYSGINDPRYKGLFDLSVFSIGEKLSYLYAVPGNLVVKAGGQDLRMKYVFVLRKPTSVKLTPVFPVGRQTAAETVEVKAQRFQLNTNVYTYLSTLEGGEPNKPGTGGGSVWWTLDAPYTGFLRVNANSVYNGHTWSPTPLVYIWEGNTLSSLTVLASNYTTFGAPGREVIAAVVAGQKLWISADRQDDGGVFNFTATMEPRPLNQDPDHATELVARETSFENGTNWAYNTAFTIYPITGDYTNNDLWFKLRAPAAARLSADTNAGLFTLYAALKHDLRITPPSRDYLGSLTLSMDTDDPAVIYYTLDGQIPTPAALPYTGPFVITNTVSVRAVAYRTNRTEIQAAENYVYHAPLGYPPPAGTNSGPYLLDLSNPDHDDATIIFRIEGGEWQTYTGPTNLDGLGDFGAGYVYFTRVLNGQTNPIQYVHLNFQLPPPQLDITNAVIPYTNSSLTVSVTNVPPGAVAVWLDNGTEHALVPDATDSSIWRLTIPISQANTYQFRLSKRGYQPSPIMTGTYTAEPVPPPTLAPLSAISGGTQPSASFTVTGLPSDSVLQVRYTQFLKSAPPLSGGALLPAAATSYSRLPGEEYRLSNPAWYVSADGAFNRDLFNHTWDSTRVDTLSPSNGEVNVTMPWGSQAQLVLIRTVWGRSAASEPVTVPITWKMPQPQYTALTSAPASWNGTNYTQFYYELQPAFRIGAIRATYNFPVGLPQPDATFAPTLYTRIYGVYLDSRGVSDLFYATDPYHDHAAQGSDVSPFAAYVQATTPADYGKWAFWTDRYAIAVNAPNNRPPGYSPPWNNMSGIASVMSLFDGWASHGLNRILTDYLYPDSVLARAKPLIHINSSGTATVVQLPVYVNLPGVFAPANIEPSDPLIIQAP